MCFNLYSVIVFLLMSISTISSDEPVCDFILSEGKLRALGLYRRLDQNDKPSYWLFRRDGNNTAKYDIEYKLSFGADWKMNVSAEGVHTIRSNHKFSIRVENGYHNCSVVKYNVCQDYN